MGLPCGSDLQGRNVGDESCPMDSPLQESSSPHMPAITPPWNSTWQSQVEPTAWHMDGRCTVGFMGVGWTSAPLDREFRSKDQVRGTGLGRERSLRHPEAWGRKPETPAETSLSALPRPPGQPDHTELEHLSPRD